MSARVFSISRAKDVPGVDIETNDGDAFWIPIVHRTRSHKKFPNHCES